MVDSFLKLAEETLKRVERPLSYSEIWKEACNLGFDKELNSNGKTPWNSLSARLQTDIRDNHSTIFCKVGSRPVKFALKSFSKEAFALTTDEQSSEKQFKEEISEKKKDNFHFNERDLHPLLTSFVAYHEHFKCYTKTIYHEGSTREQKGKNKWIHPDIVGVYFPFCNPLSKNGDYAKSTIKIIKGTSETAIKFFSFEMKKSVNFSNLRECYFQAVSNSSWANEGYLVALHFDNDNEFQDEMRRLTNAFGIGFIELDAENVEQSRILVASKVNISVDWDTVNHLVEDNPDFKKFIDDVNDDNDVSKIKSAYDECLSGEKIEDYIKSRGIK